MYKYLFLLVNVGCRRDGDGAGSVPVWKYILIFVVVYYVKANL